LYGIVGLKTHCKTTLVVREEPDGIRCYAHIGTGNYHAQDRQAVHGSGPLDLRAEHYPGRGGTLPLPDRASLKRNYRRLLVAPVNMRDRVLELIDRKLNMHELEDLRRSSPR